MAVLSNEDRFETMAEYMRKQNMNFALGNDVTGLTKPDLLAAVNALDSFLNTNASAINTAIPQPARSTLTTAQKAALLVYVINKRYIRGS